MLIAIIMSKKYNGRAKVTSGLCSALTANEIVEFNNINLGTVYHVNKV